MKPHPYLRAYMAGIALPAAVLLLLCAAFAYAEAHDWIPGQAERAVIFPMAVVPNLWGLWNILYSAAGLRARISLGLWGSLLPLILLPAGLWLAHVFSVPWVTPGYAVLVAPV